MTGSRSAAWLASALAAVLLAACGQAAPEEGSTSDAFNGPIEPGTPISAASETWTWVPIVGSACGNGIATGIGVNLTDRSDDVVIFLQGGGACWDQFTCSYPTAANLDGYGASDFAAEPLLSYEFVNRMSDGNPFKDATYVFVPYCTGDLHAGNEVHSYGSYGFVHHVGARNLEAILPRLAGTFTGPRRVFVAGSSAGGFGVQLRFHRFVAAFPEAEVHGLADGSQPVQPQNGLISTVLAVWNLQLPPGCAECATSFPALADHLGATWPDYRIGLTASTDDEVLTWFFGYPAGGSFSTATRALLASEAYGASAAQRYFARTTTAHTMLGNLGVLNDAGTLTLREWLVRWRDGDAGWVNEAPAP